MVVVLSSVGELEGGHVLATGGFPPVEDDDTGTLAFPGIGCQHLTVACVSRALTHVQLACLVVVARVNISHARMEERGVEGVAVAI